jgi:hypothetical protein
VAKFTVPLQTGSKCKRQKLEAGPSTAIDAESGVEVFSISKTNKNKKPHKVNNISEAWKLIVSFLITYVHMSRLFAIALATWCIATYLYREFSIFPRIIIHSPQKRCGKSTLLDFVEAFACNSNYMSNISPSALFRLSKGGEEMTAIIDEADTFIKHCSSDLLGILNSGHSKHRGYVIRCNSETFQPEKFPVYFPIAFGSIGKLQSTLLDRAICISLKRAPKGANIESYWGAPKDDFTDLRNFLEGWANEKQDQILSEAVRPQSLGNDRAVDNWVPLFTTAKLISEQCLNDCSAAYVALAKKEKSEDLEILLLMDIKKILDKYSHDRIPSSRIVTLLNENLDRPWCEINKGRPMSQANLAKMLKNFEIESQAMKWNNKTMRCYSTDSFSDSFLRYL